MIFPTCAHLRSFGAVRSRFLASSLFCHVLPPRSQPNASGPCLRVVGRARRYTAVDRKISVIVVTTDRRLRWGRGGGVTREFDEVSLLEEAYSEIRVWPSTLIAAGRKPVIWCVLSAGHSAQSGPRIRYVRLRHFDPTRVVRRA